MRMVVVAVPPEVSVTLPGVGTAVRLIGGQGGAGMLTQATIVTRPEKPLRLDTVRVELAEDPACRTRDPGLADIEMSGGAGVTVTTIVAVLMRL